MLLEIVRLFKYIFLLIGFFTIMITKIQYQKRTASNPDKSTPYDAREKKMINLGYASCILAIVFVILFN